MLCVSLQSLARCYNCQLIVCEAARKVQKYQSNMCINVLACSFLHAYWSSVWRANTYNLSGHFILLFSLACVLMYCRRKPMRTWGGHGNSGGPWLRLEPRTSLDSVSQSRMIHVAQAWNSPQSRLKRLQRFHRYPNTTWVWTPWRSDGCKISSIFWALTTFW